MQMKAIMKTTPLVATLTLALTGFAVVAPAAGTNDPAAHHAPVAAANEAAAKADRQMGAMRDLHAKMAAAKTPQERTALMDEHMKAMQGGMAMMGAMNGKGDMSAAPAAGSAHDTMTRRMDMMEMMMQMMMDREALKPPASK